MGSSQGFVNFYELLGVSEDADIREITTAYRLAALRHHPDKRRNPNASGEDMFQMIQQAYQILQDQEAKAAFDRVLALKKAHEKRLQEMSAQRAGMRADLLRREAQEDQRKGLLAQQQAAAQAALAVEIERLKKHTLHKTTTDSMHEATCLFTWRSQRPLTETIIKNTFANVYHVTLLDSHGNNRAKITFDSRENALMACSIPCQTGEWKLELIDHEHYHQKETQFAPSYSTMPFDELEKMVLSRLRAFQ